MDHDVRRELVALLPRLRRFAYALSGSLDEAEDIVQSACEKALARSHQFERGSRLDSWMFQIVRTTWIDKVRYRRRRDTTSDPEMLENLRFDARIEEQTEAREQLAIIRKQIATLSEDQRVVLGLVTVDGMSYQEAAEMLGVPIGTIMSRLARARRKLAEVIDPDWHRKDASPAAKHGS
jgi:RNA polymerase sigma-70 factor (ECF subfamily)